MTRILFLFSLVTAAEDWTRFRGPNGSGVAPGKGYPVRFGKGENLVWRSAVRPGKSSPVLTEKHVFLTAFAEGKLFTQCFDRATGELVWERSIDKTRSEVANALNHEAAITPVTDGRNVYVFFKDFGLVAYDPAGKELWRSPMGPFQNTMGLSSSPVLAGSNVVVVVDQLFNAFAAAFDSKSGEMRWKSGREEADGWGTPFVFNKQLVTVSRGLFGSYNTANGKRLSTQIGFPATIVGSPILDGDRMFVFGYGADAAKPFADELAKSDRNGDGKLQPEEYAKSVLLTGVARHTGNRDGVVSADEWDLLQKRIMGPNGLYAFRLETDAKTGEIRPRELWKYEKSFTSVVPSLVLHEGVLFSVRNGGILTAFDAATGRVTKNERLPGALGGYSSSPVAAEGRVYICSEEGKVVVVKAAAEWEVLAANELGEGCFATPALSGGQLYLRTDEALYRFGAGKK